MKVFTHGQLDCFKWDEIFFINELVAMVFLMIFVANVNDENRNFPHFYEDIKHSRRLLWNVDKFLIGRNRTEITALTNILMELIRQG